MLELTRRGLIATGAALAGGRGAVAQQRGGGTIVVAVPADPGHLNPGITTGSPTHTVADSIFNGLVFLDRDLTPLPDLATGWEVNEDSTAYTFRLAEDTRWHDGTPFTAADVKFTFEEVLFRYHARTRAGLAGVVASIETPDARTVVFRTRQPYGPLLQRLDVTEAPILPRHVYGTGGDPNQHPANLRPVGTGPFRLASYSRGDNVVLERNPHYFKPGLPRLDRLVFRVIPDETTQVLALQRGEVDYVGSLPFAEVERLRRAGGVALVERSSGPGGGNCIMTVSFNLERPTLARLEVRQAIAHAIDRRRMLDQVLFGFGRVAQAPISSGIAWAHWPPSLEAYRHDPSRAESLLDAAGHRRDANGRRLRLDIVHFPVFGRYVESMRQDLARVGIELVSRPLDPAAAVEAIFRQRNFDTSLISYCNGADPDIGVKRMYVSDNIGPIPFSNAAAYRDERADRLFAAAGRTAARERRRALYREAQEILGRDLPCWWLVETTFVAGHRDTLTGFAPWSGQFAEQAAYR